MKKDNMKNFSLAAQSIARYLIPNDVVQNREYWNKHVFLIKELTTFEAVLDERIHFFRKDKSRNDAFLLIMVVDMIWQVIRTLGGKSGKDKEWLKDYIPDGADAAFHPDDPASFASDRKIIDDILWVYGLNSILRHPDSRKLNTYNFLFDDPWQDSRGNRLLDAAEGLREIVSNISSHLSPGDGFEGDVEIKQKLFQTALKE